MYEFNYVVRNLVIPTYYLLLNIYQYTTMHIIDIIFITIPNYFKIYSDDKFFFLVFRNSVINSSNPDIKLCRYNNLHIHLIILQI